MYLLLQAAEKVDWFVKLANDINQTVLESINRLITSIFARLPFLLAGFVVLVLFWLLSKLVKYIFLSATKRARLDTRLRLLVSRMLVSLVILVGIFTALTVVIPSFDIATVITGLGFSSFVIGFATKDILNNFLSGVLILWQRPFEIGDYLFIGKDQGKVEYIGVRATSLRKDDGELLLIPNGDMYSSALTIRGAGANRRMTLKFNVDYGEDIEKSKTITFDALTRTDGVVIDPKPNVYVSDLTADGIAVTVNFWINTNESKPLGVFDRAAIAITKSLHDADVQLYPPGTMIVRQPAEEQEEEETKPKKTDW